MRGRVAFGGGMCPVLWAAGLWTVRSSDITGEPMSWAGLRTQKKPAAPPPDQAGSGDIPALTGVGRPGHGEVASLGPGAKHSRACGPAWPVILGGPRTSRARSCPAPSSAPPLVGMFLPL